MFDYDVIVVGGGAAGLMAAGKSAEIGKKVLLIEKMNQPGRKLRITGKGRCNLTNHKPLREFLSHIGENSRFLKHAFSIFFVEQLISFFREKGVEITVERGDRVFPTSEKAQDIFNALVTWVEKNRVKIKRDTSVKEIIVENNKVIGVKVSENEKYFAPKVILATGGASYPATGSTGDGYIIAEKAGHKIVPVKPALVPLETKGDIALQLQGLSLKNVKVSFWLNGKKLGDEFGEMLFTHFGLSGPIILTLSRRFCNELSEKKPIVCSIDLKPALDDKQLDNRLLKDLNEHGKMQFKSITRNWLPGKLAEIFPDLIGIPHKKLCNQINAEERKRIRKWLKDFKFEIVGTRGFNEAIITSGGIDLNEIDPNTMQSKIISGLYFAGEVIDLDADTGGYNLQIAFSTAWLSAIS